MNECLATRELDTKTGIASSRWDGLAHSRRAKAPAPSPSSRSRRRARRSASLTHAPNLRWMWRREGEAIERADGCGGRLDGLTCKPGTRAPGAVEGPATVTERVVAF